MRTPKFVLMALATAVAGSSAVTPNFAKINVQPVNATVTEPESGVPKPALTLTAKAGFLIEANSGQVLFTHNAEQRLPIASMTKVATLGVIYDALADGTITMDTPVLVSERASSMGGSQAFLDAGSEYPVRELIQSIVVASANDSCVAMAEKIAGSVENFVERMNNFAKSVDCQNTNFVNCTGLPATGAYSCASDMAKMYQKIMQSPHYADFNTVWMYDLTHPSGRVTGLTNTNKLIRQYQGCVGGKTGFTNEAGHCITVSAKRGDLQPIAVVIGAPDSKTRFAESRRLLDYAFDNYENKLIVDKTQPIKDVAVTNAVVEWTTLYPAEDFYQLCPRGVESNLTIASEIPDQISAPIKPTDACGKIYVMQDGKVLREIAVQTNADLPGATYLDNLQKLARKSRF